MKHRLYIVGLLSIFVFCISCEDFKLGNAFLEKPLTTDVNIDTIFNNRKYAEQILNQAYHSLPDFQQAENQMYIEILTDLGDGQSAYYSGQVSPSSPDQLPYDLRDLKNARHTGPISGIRQAYIYIENVDRVPDMTDEEKAQRKAEAQMIIAYHYSDMFRHYGGVPLIDHVYTPGEDMNFVRMTAMETLEHICDLCDEAAPYLPWYASGNDEGRMTRAAALALKNRVLTFAASPLFNNDEPFRQGEASDKLLTWFGHKDMGLWEAALESGLEFLRENQSNEGYYSLVDTGDPRADFLAGYYNRGQQECMIVSHRYNKMSNVYYYCFRRVYWGSALIPTAHYGDMFEWKDGSEFDWDNPEHAKYPFFDEKGNMNRDPRLYETLWVNGDPKFNGRTCELYMNRGNAYKKGRECWDASGSTLSSSVYNGYGFRKFMLDYSSELFAHYYQCPLMRLPEIYLNIAEAMNELGITGRDEFGRDAYDYVDLVRNRVDMPKINRAKYPMGAQFLEAILHERAVEFGYEEVRYFDINRRMRKDLLDVEHFRLLTYKEDDGSFTYEKSTENMIRPDRIWLQRWDNRYYLCPFDVAEINKKYGLIQNPGWE